MLFRTVATVAYVAYVVSHHDDHYHHSTCGHPSVVVDGRHVHKYQDRWEYWDEERGEWYYYPDARFEDDWDYR